MNTINPHRTEAGHQDAKVRRKNFLEVVTGYDEKAAHSEANRCLQCKKPACITGCPVNINIKGFINAVTKHRYEVAYRIITEANLFPSICGRVCPQEVQCEAKCLVGKKHAPVAIGTLERFVGDIAMKNDWKDNSEIKRIGKRAAIIGSGPSGLACASDLAKAGFEVVIFEALHLPGGVLMYGIPEFRLPKGIVLKEIENLKTLGVRIETNKIIGKTHTIEDLMHKHHFDAVFIGTGAGYPQSPGIKGEFLNGVMSANEFLTRVNLMHGYDFPNHATPVGIGHNIAVIGCGNTAMDAARVALRLNTKNVYIVYRRTVNESPARKEEIKHAMEEGIQFIWLTAPVEITGTPDGWIKGMQCIKLTQGQPDNKGRLTVSPIEGSEFTLDVDTVIYALGTMANPIIGKTTPHLKLDKNGYIPVDDDTQMTSIPGVFAGGDISKSSWAFTTVIHAMSKGRRAAKGIIDFVNEGEKKDK
ncbi:MAG: NADPH-dependent glutamate synthase [Nitrospirae bacterium YQR-1]